MNGPPDQLVLLSVRVPRRLIGEMDECAAIDAVTRSDWTRRWLESAVLAYEDERASYPEYEPCVIDSQGRCTRLSHVHSGGVYGELSEPSLASYPTPEGNDDA